MPSSSPFRPVHKLEILTLELDRFEGGRPVEDLLAERGIIVSYESIRQWCRKFGPAYVRALKRRQGRLGDTWHLDELFVTIQGRILSDEGSKSG